MSTFTVFAFGTGKHSKMKKRDIISEFSTACTGEKTIIEGPDSLGFRVKGNVRDKTREIITWLSRQADSDNTINMAGYSRGAITCIKVANRLKGIEERLAKSDLQDTLDAKGKKLLSQLQGLKINIYGLDPVAGMGDKSSVDSRVLPSNVKNYVAVLTTDEMRRDFKPQDLSRMIVASPATKVSMLPMYGNHSDTTKIKNAGMQSGAILNWYTLHQFLTMHGTPFANDAIPPIVSSKLEYASLPENPGSKDLLKLFAHLHLERPNYLASGLRLGLADGLPYARKARTFNKHLDLYVKNPEFFTSQLERELFKISYPNVFNYLFEQNQIDFRYPDASASDKTEVVAELSLLNQENPDLFTRLQPLNVTIDGQDTIHLGDPQGMFVIEFCATLQQLYPEMLKDSVRTHTPNMPQDSLQNLPAFIGKLPALERDIHQATLRYERDKSSLSPFTTRSQAGRAQQIRQEVLHVINHQQHDSDSKVEKVLDILEKHFISLVRADSTSDLVGMLGRTLRDYNRSYQVHYSTLGREILGDFVHLILGLLKETINFIGNFGHLGGGVLSVIGVGMRDFGKRTNEMLGTLGFNPIKYVISAVAYVFQAVGIAIKNSFGIKPLTRLIVAGVESIKEAIETYVRGIKLERHLAGPQPHQDAHHSPSFFHEQGHNARVEGVHDDEPQPESP